MRAKSRRSQARAKRCTGQSTVHVRCATGHPGGPSSQSSNGRNPTTLVTWLAHRTVRCAPDCPVHHRTCPVHQDSPRAELLAFGKTQSRSAIIHRTVRCTPDSVRCSKRTQLCNLAASGICNGCSAIIHRTCPVYTGLSGATAEQRLLRTNGHLQAHSMRARSAQKAGTPMLVHRTL